MEGGGRGRARGALCQDDGARRGGAAGGHGLSARNCRIERGGQRQGASGRGPGAARSCPRGARGRRRRPIWTNCARACSCRPSSRRCIYAQNALEKDLILLKREIGIDPGQKIALTDPAPYSELAEQTPEEVRAMAYKNRQDYQNLQNQVVSTRPSTLPIAASGCPRWLQQLLRHQHGQRRRHARQLRRHGHAQLPLFREARLRGDEDASAAQMDAVNAQLADLRNHIDEQVRAALLDVDASQSWWRWRDRTSTWPPAR